MAELKGHVPRDQNFVSVAVMYTYDPVSGEYAPFQGTTISGSSSATSSSSNSIQTGKLVVGVTPIQCPDIPSKYVVIMNHTSGSTLYLGSDASLTSDNGFGALENTDVTQQLNISNFSLLYLVSSVPNSDVRYFIGA